AEGRDVVAVAATEGAGERKVHALGAAAHERGDERRRVGAALALEARVPPPTPSSLGDDADDARGSVGAVEGALRPAQNLDPLDAGSQQAAEIELALADLARVHAVDQDQHMVALCAPDADLGEASDIAGARDGDAGHLT